MDEVIFRTSQRLDQLQFQIGNGLIEGKKLILLYSSRTKDLLHETLSSPQTENIKNYLKEFILYIADCADELRCTILYHLNINRLISKLHFFNRQWTARDVCFGCAGLVIGGMIGLCIGFAYRRNRTFSYMQAIQCSHYIGIEGTSCVGNAIAPKICDDNEVLIEVKAGSLHIVDIDIANGYGCNLRKYLSRSSQYSKSDLPVTIGRDCSGVVINIGKNVTKVEIGDHVWVTAPFWEQGTLAEFILAPESRVGKKPLKIGFEGASSLPYAGTVALDALNKIKLSEKNANGKRVFIQGGCTPVGCIIMQILNTWGAHITTTCFQRARPVASALGAKDVIILSDADPNTDFKTSLHDLHEYTKNYLIKELILRDKFDIIIETRKCGLQIDDYLKFCNPKGEILFTTSSTLSSDSYKGLLAIMFGLYIKFWCSIKRFMGDKIEGFGEPKISVDLLDNLKELVEKGELTTIVDKVFHPSDIETAMYHIQSTKSIGSTVITFR